MATAEQTAVPPYRLDVINAAIGAQRLTNETVAEKAGVGVRTVSEVRDGKRNVGVETLKKIVDALGLTMEEIFRERAA